MARQVRSFVHQTFHYLARPHLSVRLEPVSGPAAWTTESLQRSAAWRYELSGTQQDACVRAVERATAESPDPATWTPTTFRLDGFDTLIAEWRAQLDGRGRGFQVVRGVPVDRLGSDGTEAFFWGLGRLLGVPGAQNTDGDLLGHVMDLRDPTPGRLYRTAQPIRFHCDTADVVGLLCLSTPKSGGMSRIASSLAIYNEILVRRPDLVPRLYERFAADAHGQRGMPYMYTYCARHAGDRLRIFYHSDYFRSGAVKAQGALDERTEALLDLFDELADSPQFCLRMPLEVGDIQLVSNHSVVHARDGYEDFEDAARRRHLLRLWLSLRTDSGARTQRVRAWMGTLGYAARARLTGWVR